MRASAARDAGKVEQVDPAGPERRLHRVGEEVVQALVAGRAGPAACEPSRLADAVQLRHRCAQRIHPEVMDECITKRHARGRLRSEHPIEQPVDVVDEAVVVESNPVPLENRELPVVVTAAFAVPERPRDLVDRSAARRQQPLHRELGRRLEIPGASRAVVQPEAFDRRVRHGGRAERRRLDLHDALIVEVPAHHAQETGPKPQRVDVRARTPLAPGSRRVRRRAGGRFMHADQDLAPPVTRSDILSRVDLHR